MYLNLNLNEIQVGFAALASAAPNSKISNWSEFRGLRARGTGANLSGDNSKGKFAPEFFFGVNFVVYWRYRREFC